MGDDEINAVAYTTYICVSSFCILYRSTNLLLIYRRSFIYITVCTCVYIYKLLFNHWISSLQRSQLLFGNSRKGRITDSVPISRGSASASSRTHQQATRVKGLHLRYRKMRRCSSTSMITYRSSCERESRNFYLIKSNPPGFVCPLTSSSIFSFFSLQFSNLKSIIRNFFVKTYLTS